MGNAFLLMSLMNLLKGQASALNVVVFLVCISLILFWLKKIRVGRIVLVFSIVIFYVISTDFLPRYLVRRMESKHPALKDCYLFNLNKPVLIHVLGGGYTADERLPALSQLSLESKGRLMEAIRLMNCYDGSLLICSGHHVSGSQSMAEIYQAAALSLKVAPEKIVILDTPANTREEAEALISKFGTEVHIILVTSAIHMDRAMMFFQQQGIHPVPAPTNYLVKQQESGDRLRAWPSVDNIRMMDAVIHEYLGTLKGMYNW